MVRAIEYGMSVNSETCLLDPFRYLVRIVYQNGIFQWGVESSCRAVEK